MAQTRVCSYFKTDCKHASLQPTTFLALPENLRLRVYYLQADNTTITSIYFRETNGIPLFCTADDCPATALASYSNLRLVSRTVNADVPKCLCSNYRITFCGADILKASLPMLVELPWSLLSYCRRLTIILNMSLEHHHALCCCQYCRSSTRGSSSSRRPGSVWDSNVIQGFLPAWKEIVRQLALSPNASKLELRLICDTEDSRAADLILKPLKRLQVSKCTVRLNKEYNPELESIAREVVFNVTGHIPAVRDPFRFLDLPTELRLHVLSFTDLVTPFHEVQWAPNIFHLQDITARRLTRCELDEFCSLHSTVYPTCVCFRAPRPFFLVCRAMLRDSRQTFYTHNRVIVMSKYTNPRSQPQSPREKSFEAATFLTKTIPRDGLASLRDLEILFSPRQYSHMGILPSVLSDWEHAIQYAAPHLKKLSLTLSMGTEDYPQPDPIFAEDILASQKSLFNVHEQIVFPLRQLQCLDVFFVRAGFPFRFSETEWTRIEQILELHERHLEALVMGSAYDSAAKGKAQRRRSRWVSEMYDYS